MSDERREDQRFLACFAASVDHGGESRPRSALIQNISVSGTALLTRAHVEAGDSVSMDLFLSKGAEAKQITGRVVRVEECVSSPFWSRSVAVQFDHVAVEYEVEIKALAAEQKGHGLFSQS